MCFRFAHSRHHMLDNTFAQVMKDTFLQRHAHMNGHKYQWKKVPFAILLVLTISQVIDTIDLICIDLKFESDLINQVKFYYSDHV